MFTGIVAVLEHHVFGIVFAFMLLLILYEPNAVERIKRVSMKRGITGIVIIYFVIIVIQIIRVILI